VYTGRRGRSWIIGLRAARRLPQLTERDASGFRRSPTFVRVRNGVLDLSGAALAIAHLAQGCASRSSRARRALAIDLLPGRYRLKLAVVDGGPRRAHV
jgi:hypothetical protein